jgi:hypothetical protein
MPELAIVSTLVLIAAPIVLVGATALAALIKRRPTDRRLEGRKSVGVNARGSDAG